MANKVWKDTASYTSETPTQDVKFMRDELKATVDRARREYWFWREAPLRLFIECTPADLRGQEAKLRDLWWVTSTDLLITTRAPDYTPLLAVEYDGNHHDSTAQQATDAKRNEIFRRSGIPLLRIRYDDVNGRDPVVMPRPEAAIRLIVQRRVRLKKEDVRLVNAKITALWRKAFKRAKERDELRPETFRIDKYLTTEEDCARFELELERHLYLTDDEADDVRMSEAEAERYYGVRVTLCSVESGDFGHVACVSCAQLNGRAIGKIYGDHIRLVGAENEELAYAERQIAIGAAFDLAARTYGKK